MYHKLILKHGRDILNSSNFMKTREHIQHGNVTVHEHCINVATTSIKIKEKLHINCNDKDLVRGALLHDYFLYDWHIGDKADPRNLHGFRHPGVALLNAKKEYTLTKRQEDIIKHHMWPLTFKPPKCREAWIVTMADKYCSTLETLHLMRGKILKKKAI